MSGKYEKKSVKNRTQKRAPLVIAAIVLLLVAAAVVFLLFGRQEEHNVSVPGTEAENMIQNEPVEVEEHDQPMMVLSHDLVVTDVGSYTGAFVEDGSDEILAGILMMKIENRGEDAIEYAGITMDVNGTMAEFALSALKPGASVVLLEKNRMTYDRSVDYSAVQVKCENVAVFQDKLKLHDDKLKIQILDGAINVKNISGEDITGRVAIYYKNTADGIYYGGITYRIVLENGLKAGEIQQMMAEHFSKTGSEILFVTIAK